MFLCKQNYKLLPHGQKDGISLEVWHEDELMVHIYSIFFFATERGLQKESGAEINLGKLKMSMVMGRMTRKMWILNMRRQTWKKKAHMIQK